MGRNTLVDTQKLEDFIVQAFMTYEKGLWPISMRHEAKSIIRVCRVDYREEEDEVIVD